MKPVHIGDRAPDFVARDQNGQTVELSAYRGHHVVVIFFYPADGSPICTKQACVFRDAFEAFTDAGAVVMGVSGDGVARHQQFAQAHRLPFLLLADKEGAVRRAFGVPKISVKRAVKLYREAGPKGFYAKRKGRGPAVLTPEVLAQAQPLFDQGLETSEVADRLGLKADTLSKAVRGGRLHKPAKKKPLSRR